MDETLRNFHRVLSFAGIRIYAKTNWDSKPWLIFQAYNVFIGLLTFIFTTGFVIVSASDIEMWIEGTGIWTTGVIMSISLVVCLIFRKDFRIFLEEKGFKDSMLDMPLVEHVLKLDVDGKLNELKQMVVESQEKLLKLIRILLKIYVFCVWFVATMYICDPIYEMAVRKDKSLRLLAFKMWFPWSLENFKVYIISFIYHVNAGYLCCVAYPGLQSTIILLNGQVIRQLKILSFILSNLDDLVLELVLKRDERWQSHCTLILSQCVQHWVELKTFSNRLNRICRYFYLTLILVAILLVCVCSVKIAISDKLSLDTMKYYMHGFSFILVVLMFCYLGQQVQNESEMMRIAVIEKWYIYNTEHTRNVRIFQKALSQMMPIYIFGTIPLSLPTFTWFLKTGMSFFTLIMSVVEDIG